MPYLNLGNGSNVLLDLGLGNILKVVSTIAPSVLIEPHSNFG